MVVTGGARSGKSGFAERRLAELAPSGPWRYVATAEAGDGEMAARIARHRERRGAGWSTVEAPRDLEAALLVRDGAAGVLVDCITLWVTNWMLADASDDAILAAAEALPRAATLPTVIVTNEVGLGIVPDNALARRFRDLAGLVNQRLAAASDEAWLLAAGLPLRLR
ncbi:MAG: bifunctional adenosylcobinamide kinase/adenosylcobinamide-phosphate guanylyltransferase [Myxococcales bacterium]|nr:bifunctional adenosylcobinamide kinase/adenosylcobinamide-phosphate guanylyltransferase [Myxococcales bacterium]